MTTITTGIQATAANTMANIHDISTESLERLVEQAFTEMNSDEEITDNEDILEDNTNELIVTENNSRFQGAMWFEAMKNISVTIAGLGGIGSWTALLISRLNVGKITLIDPDTIDIANMSGQLYENHDISEFKARAIRHMLIRFSRYYSCNVYTNTVENCYLDGNVFICGFDNMNARKAAFNKWLDMISVSSCKEKYLFIDGRLDAEDFQIFCIQGNDDYHIKKYMSEYLYADSEVDEAPCSFKQTSYLASMIGSFITNIFVNFVSNMEVEFCKVTAFKTSFNTSTFTLKLED